MKLNKCKFRGYGGRRRSGRLHPLQFSQEATGRAEPQGSAVNQLLNPLVDAGKPGAENTASLLNTEALKLEARTQAAAFKPLPPAARTNRGAAAAGCRLPGGNSGRRVHSAKLLHGRGYYPLEPERRQREHITQLKNKGSPPYWGVYVQILVARLHSRPKICDLKTCA